MSAGTQLPRSIWRKMRFPAIIIAIPVLLIVLESLWDRLEWSPDLYMYVGMGMNFSVMLAPVILLVWFLFFSGFTKQTRFGGLTLLLVLAGAAFTLIRKVEFTGKMKPILYYRWEAMPQDQMPVLVAMPASTPYDLTILPEDSPKLRGYRGDGTTLGVPTDLNWIKLAGEKHWQHPLGGGHAGIAVAGQLAFTIEQRGENEAIVAYAEGSGEPRWVHQYPAAFKHSEPMGGNGPRTTPTLVEGLLYCLGGQGHLHCLDAANGQVKWKTNILEDAGAKNLEWGMSSSPLVVGNVVYVNPGIDPDKKTQQAVAAYDRLTGKKLWSAGSDQAGYSSLMMAKLAGAEQLLLFDAAGLKGLDTKDGKQLWLYPWKTSFDMNCAQPIVIGDDQVFISSEVSNGGAMLKLSHEGDNWKVSEIWKTKYLGIKFSNAVLHRDHLYGLGNGYLTCLDAKTGERKWKSRLSYGNGQILLAGDVLVITAEDGFVALVAADATKFNELKRIPVFTGRTWNVPAIARGKLYLRNHQEMACVKLW